MVRFVVSNWQLRKNNDFESKDEDNDLSSNMS